ncbi:hypothetical protein MSAS_11420 [Mycobacterium saskatchewanense]|nr:hypothetical protein MSAS_11420 [Mycobacterium saskatchewanense]
MRSIAEEDSSATATCGLGVRMAARPPAIVRAISSSKPPDMRRRSRRRERSDPPLRGLRSTESRPDLLDPNFFNRALLFVQRLLIE